MLITSRAVPRRILVAAAALGLTAASLTAVSAPASADSPTTLNVVGTSDVSDSNLMQSVIEPKFEAKYPQYTINYIPKGTGAALKYAEAGTADAVIVHAPSLENQFVANGYSLEPEGRAVFYGDYILAGATGDPAMVSSNASHNIVQAFEDIALAGTTPNTSGDPSAYFISRGDLSGTNVQENQIWALTTGVPTCNVPSANGGGAMPSTTDIGQTCPTTPTPPAWYKTTGDTQAPNVEYANTCTPAGSSANDCYVFTDRGTFDYLSSGGTASNPTVKPTNLTILTRDNAASAPGGTTELINTFHAYAVNPTKTGTSLNTVGATDLLNWMTSPAGQQAIGNYVPYSQDTAPFIKDAAPQVTDQSPTGTVTGGTTQTVSGSLTNVVPGTPSLSGFQVQLFGTPSVTPKATPTLIDSTDTDTSGDFTLTFTPSVTMNYTLQTPAIVQTEYPDLSPQFADQLQPTTTNLGKVSVRGVVQNVTAKVSGSTVNISGVTKPARHSGSPTVALYARPAGTKQAFTSHGKRAIMSGSSFHAQFSLPKGTWNYYIQYSNPDYILPGQSATNTVTVR